MSTRSGSGRLVALVAVLATPLLVAVPANVAHADSCVGGVESDFNGDGVKDIAIGDAFGLVGDIGAGTVEVRYSGTQLIQVISEASAGIPGSPEEHDNFGKALASYDYNGDGCSDLVVGAPDESLGKKESAGTVTVIPGAPRGLWTQGAFALTQNKPGMPGKAETHDRFGSALAAGNTRSGEPFLVIGVPDETVGDGSRGFAQGAFDYMRGSINVLVSQDTRGVPGSSETFDGFGSAIAATRDHVIVASAEEALRHNGTNRKDAGAIHIFTHAFSSTGRPGWARMIDQNTRGVSGAPEAGDGFGGGFVYGEGPVSAMAYRPSGVSNRDAGSLIAVGVPGEDIGSVVDAGMVQLLYVSRRGAFGQLRVISQNTAGVSGGAERHDMFGDTVTLLGNRGNEATTPGTTRLLVAAREERANNASGVYQLFSLAGAPGHRDIWIGNGTFGLHYASLSIGPHAGTTDTDLYLQGPAWQEISVVPWANILDGASQPVRVIQPVRGTGGFWGIAMV